MGIFSGINTRTIISTLLVSVILCAVSCGVLTTYGYSTDYTTLIVWTEGGKFLGLLPRQWWSNSIVKDNYIYSSNGLLTLLSGKNMHFYDTRDLIIQNPSWTTEDLAAYVRDTITGLPGQSVLVMVGHGTQYAFAAYRYMGDFLYISDYSLPDSWTASTNNVSLVWAHEVRNALASKPIYDLPSVIILVFCNSLGDSLSFDKLMAPNTDSWQYAFKFLPSEQPLSLYGRELVGFLTLVKAKYDAYHGTYESAGHRFAKLFMNYSLIQGRPFHEAFRLALQNAEYSGYPVYLTSAYYQTIIKESYNYSAPNSEFSDEASAAVGYYYSYADPTPADLIVPKVLEQVRQFYPSIYDKLVRGNYTAKVLRHGKDFDIVGYGGEVLHLYDILWYPQSEGGDYVAATARVSDDFSHVYLTSLDVTYYSSPPPKEEIEDRLDTLANQIIREAEELGLGYEKLSDGYIMTYNGSYVYFPSAGPDPFKSPKPVWVKYGVETDGRKVLAFWVHNTFSLLSEARKIRSLKSVLAPHDAVRMAGLESAEARVRLAWIINGTLLRPVYIVKAGDDSAVIDAVSGDIISKYTVMPFGGAGTDYDANDNRNGGGIPDIALSQYVLVAVAVSTVVVLYLAWRRWRRG